MHPSLFFINTDNKGERLLSNQGKTPIRFCFENEIALEIKISLATSDRKRDPSDKHSSHEQATVLKIMRVELQGALFFLASDGLSETNQSFHPVALVFRYSLYSSTRPFTALIATRFIETHSFSCSFSKSREWMLHSVKERGTLHRVQLSSERSIARRRPNPIRMVIHLFQTVQLIPSAEWRKSKCGKLDHLV